MRLEHIEIRGFRNHPDSVLDCSAGVNAIFGDNGEGKTNIVEAISYLCLAKSFYAASDFVALRTGSERFDVQGIFLTDADATSTVRVSFEKTPGKKTITVNKTPVETLSSVVGQFPAVVLSPEQNGITFGAPTERRRFLDLAICQASKAYLNEILEYRKILRQRNKILLDAKTTRRDCSDLLEPWDESLARTGSSIMIRREKFLETFCVLMKEQFRGLVNGNEQPQIRYAPSFEVSSPMSREEVEQRFTEELGIRADEERRTGTTAVGPHRDELEFSIDGLNLRKFASQGQHKTFLLSLKLAEFFYLQEQKNETPILLLDDVFSELDAHRSKRLLDLAERVGQVFITSTDDRSFPSGFRWDGDHRKFLVREGTIQHHAENRLFVN